MKRYLCWLALLGVVALPDWASAFHPFHPCWAPPPPCGPFGFGLFGRAVPIYPQPPVYVAPAVPVYEVPLSPRVYVAPVPTTAAIPPAAQVAPSKPPVVTVEPAASPAPMSVKPREADPKVKPAGGDADTRPTILPPVRNDPPTPAAPPLVLPPIPGMNDPKPMTPAAPTPAPPPAAGDNNPIIPLPGLPEPKKPKASTSDDTLPPLVLPPETGEAPSGIVPPINSTSRSSPLSGGLKASVFTTAGTPASARTRKVGFFNHTDRDIKLVIEGQATTLPKKTYIHAEVPPSFQWKYADTAMRSATVPDGAAGLDVLFSE
jgi:hypothetical protein